MAASSEATGLKSISTIRYKIATASSEEEALSQVLQAHLVPLLAKAGSPHKTVRDAAFGAYISISSFIQPPGVVLPVQALLAQYKSSISPVVKQLDLGLIKKGLSRLGQVQRRELFPAVVRGISKETNAASASGLFAVFLRLLLEINIPPRGSKDDAALRDNLGLSDASDAKYISSWLGKLLLFRAVDDQAQSSTPLGLTKQDMDYLRNNDPKLWKVGEPGALSLPECKLKAVNFLASGAFTDEERFLPSICASGSSDAKITAVAEDMIKRSTLDLESQDTIQILYQSHKNLPAPHRMQILKLLSKSVAACSYGEDILETVKADFELTTGAGDGARVAGLEALRLHRNMLAFLSWIARNSSTTAVASQIGSSLVFLLKDYILRQGWPDARPNANQLQQHDEQRLRANAYETIGSLARCSQMEAKARESLLKWLFDSLVSDTSSDSLYIESALSSMMALFKTPTETDNRRLECLLVDYMTLPERQGARTARHIAARFANNCLPYSNIQARWIDILAVCAGGERRDVLEEGQRGLDPWWAAKLGVDDGLILPDWAKMVRTFFHTASGQAESQLTSCSPHERLRAFPIALKYSKQIILLTALKESEVEIDWESQLVSRLQNDLRTRQVVRKYLATADHEALEILLNAGLDHIRDHPELGLEESIRCVADLLAFTPTEAVVASLSDRSPELLALAKSNNQEVRQLGAKAFGILVPWSGQAASLLSQLRSLLESCAEPSAAQSAEYQGWVAYLGSYLCHAALYGKMPAPNVTERSEFLSGLFTTASKSTDQRVRDAGMELMSRLWAVNMAFPRGDGFETTVARIMESISSGSEKALTGLGRLAMPEAADTDAVTSILDRLFGLTGTEAMAAFATGEAIAAVILRWDSEAVQLAFDMDPDGPATLALKGMLARRPSVVTTTLDKLVSDCKSTKPSLLKASGIWLFCVIQYGSHLPEVQSRLRQCQAVFTRLLAARDVMVQETASRGLALCYERGDEGLKEALVKDLVATFTGSRTQLKVDDETELFDAGALPTGEGKSVQTYRDIIKLAEEVGDHSIIPKFMALATNAATWTARSAFGRFGLSSILSDAELEPKTIIKLYRYRFDPNPNVRKSMDDIWNAVVKDSAATINLHFSQLVESLLESILDGKEWRVREASCAAIGELLYGRPFATYQRYYTRIWEVTLRVLDDRKESVRAAALKLCLGLSKTLVTQLQEDGTSSSAKAMISEVLPFLLSDKAVGSSVSEVQAVAISTVVEVSRKGSGAALKPFASTIIIHFLGLLSTVEPEAVNYYYQRFGEEDREKLDKMRINAAQSSPLMECITNCIRAMDEDVMEELAPRLEKTFRHIGIQTRGGCAEVLISLALRHTFLLQPHSNTFLLAVAKQILDKNAAVSMAFAKASAYLLRTASTEARDGFTSKLTELYFTADDEVRRQKIADAVLAIAKLSPDVFTELESSLLPLCYFAKHDTDGYVAEAFEAVWSQHAGGVTRFVHEMTDNVSVALATSRWALQHCAALTLADMINAMSKTVGREGQFSDATVARLWPVLDKSLALKTFKGKEKLVTAFPVFVQHSKSLWAADSSVAGELKKMAIREAKRTNPSYRPDAIEALARFAAVRTDLDMYQEVVDIVAEHLASDGKTPSHSLTELERSTTAAALKASMTAYSRPKYHADAVAVLEDVLSTVERAKVAVSVARHTFFTCTLDLLREAPAASTGPSKDVSSTLLALRWFRLLAADEADVLAESQRESRARALNALVGAWHRGVFGPVAGQAATAEEMRRGLDGLAEVERSLDVQKLLKLAAQRL